MSLFEQLRRKGREGVLGFFLVGEGFYQEKGTLWGAGAVERALFTLAVQFLLGVG